MHKRYEEEQWRIEHAYNATITFTIALHGPHAWEMRMEDSPRYHGSSHGWATEDPHLGKYHRARAASVFRQELMPGRDTSDTKSTILDIPTKPM
jgi:hypothetical protein